MVQTKLLVGKYGEPGLTKTRDGKRHSVQKMREASPFVVNCGETMRKNGKSCKILEISFLEEKYEKTSNLHR
jgi:hypothetical protein